MLKITRKKSLSPDKVFENSPMLSNFKLLNQNAAPVETKPPNQRKVSENKEQSKPILASDFIKDMMNKDKLKSIQNAGFSKLKLRRSPVRIGLNYPIQTQASAENEALSFTLDMKRIGIMADI
jgi:hypothetical protein